MRRQSVRLRLSSAFGGAACRGGSPKGGAGQRLDSAGAAVFLGPYSVRTCPGGLGGFCVAARPLAPLARGALSSVGGGASVARSCQFLLLWTREHRRSLTAASLGD